MKRSLAALIGSSISAVIFICLDAIATSGPTTVTIGSAATQSQSTEMMYLILLLFLPPLVAGIIAGILAAQRSLHGGGRGVKAGLLTALFLAIVQLIVSIGNIISAPFRGIFAHEFYAVVLFIVFILCLICDFALAPAFGAIAGTITSRLTYKSQMQEEAAAVTTENIPNNK